MSDQQIEGFRLSPQQRRAWSLSRTEGGGGGSWFVLRLAAEVSSERLRQALTEAAQRHDALRTAYSRLPGMKWPVQVVGEQEPLWRTVDLEGRELDSLFEEEGRRPFDPQAGPSVRATLISASEGARYLHVALVALSADDRSIQNLVSELARACGGDPEASAETVSYLQFSEFQNTLLEGEEGEDSRDFWSRKDLASLPRLKLPFIREVDETSAGETSGPRLRRVEGQVDPEVASALLDIVGQHEFSLDDFLFAAWKVLLLRLTGQGEMVVARLVDGRSYEIFDGAVGLFARWLPIDSRFSAGQSFNEVVELLAEAGEAAEDAADGFIWDGDRDESETVESETAVSAPAVGFVFEETVSDGIQPEDGDALIHLVRKEVHFERCDLALHCRLEENSELEKNSRFFLEMVYDSSRFDDADVERTAAELHQLLAAAAQDPASPLEALTILEPAERQRILVDHNQTARDFTPWAGFHRWFEEQAEQSPGDPAVVCGDHQLTYAELNERANRLARFLGSLELATEAHVVLCLDRSVEVMVSLLGVMKAGGVYVFLAPSQPQKRLSYMLEDLAPPVVITQAHWRSELPETAARVVAIDTEWDEIVRTSETHSDEVRGGENLDVDVDPSQLAYLVFTSGSTGRPKGVMVEHRQLLNYVGSMLERLDFPAGANFATVSTFAADLANTMVFPALVTGGCLHVISEEVAADPMALGQYFERHSIDCLKIVPSHLEALLHAGDPRKLIPRQRLVMGGEALQPSTLSEIRQASPECVVFNHYGPSETTVGVTTFRLGKKLDERCRTVPLGHPIHNVQTYLVDGRLEPVPAFVGGELMIGGAGVARGYLGRPALTAERFVPDPFAPDSSPEAEGARMYRSGDKACRLAGGGHLPGGEIVFLGRIDNQVKFHGFRVELDELRAALNRHKKVRDSVVAIKQDKFDRDVLVAYYVSRQEVETTELRKLLGEVILEETLPNLFVHLRKLPLTLNGKVNTKALPGVEEAQLSKRRYVAPRTPTEELMVEIWKEVLGSPRIGVEDNFFDLGGHSLLATQLVSRVRQTFGLELPLLMLFESDDLGRFTAKVESGLAAGEAPATIEPISRAQEIPLSFAQERLWFADQMEPGNAAYNIHGAFRLRGSLDWKALGRSLEATVERHESLRTIFDTVEGRAIQVVTGSSAASLPKVDLRALPEDRREAETQALLTREERRPFDLARGPLLRLMLLRAADDEHVLSLTVHHIIADGASLGILMGEITGTYEGFTTTGQLKPLPALPIQYADFSFWQRQWLQGENLENQLAYWKKKLHGMPEEVTLPTDRPRPAVASFAGGNHTFLFSPELSRSLQGLSRERRVTLFMSMLAAFNVLLARYADQEDVVVGIDLANRGRLETEGLIGFFVNNLVLRTDLSGDPTFGELLERVRETTLGAFANQDMPFERLVKALKPKREFGQMPLFQILFAQQNTRPTSFSLPGLELEPLPGRKVTAKFDLAFFFVERDGQIGGRWNYRTDLFEETTIVKLAQQFEKLIKSICDQPEGRLTSFEMLSLRERREKAVVKKERRSRKAGSLRKTRRQTIDLENIDVVKTGFLDGASEMPLIVEPNMEGVDLIDWASSNRELVEGRLLEHGAILFRGFADVSVSTFEGFARAVTKELYGDYGDLPREDGSEKVYHSTPYPPDKMILFHNESSHMARWPTRQLFYCVTAAQSGGETPIVDCRKAYQALDAEITRRLADKKVMYMRNFTDGLDVSWQHFFQTEDRAVVEQTCQEWGMDFEWKEDGLRTRQVTDAVARHPQTGEMLFFNQIQLFHTACLEAETRGGMLEVFGDQDLPRDFRYGDGTPVEDEVVEAISENYRQLAVAFPWRETDILLLDNMLVAHARNPFSGPRKIVVAMGDMISRDQLQS